jgi:uncharacterized protein YaiL (DUF2058 family)
MTNALQEQLLKAGLATKEQIEKANQPRRPRKHHKKQSQNKSRHTKPAHKKATDGMDLKDAFAARRREEQKEVAQKKADSARRKANKEKINQLIKKNALDTKGGEFEYQFIVGSSIKKIWVTEAQKLLLLEGKVGVTFLGSKRCLIPLSVIDEIRQLDPKKVISLASAENSPEEDEHIVPDDLVW